MKHALRSTAIQCASLLALILGVWTGPASGVVWNEIGDAGDLPATAQIIFGSGDISSVSGTLSSLADVDMFAFRVLGGSPLVLTTSATSTIDAQLFLFTASGMAILGNDDTASSLDAAITTLLSPGLYFFAISAFDRDPVNAANQEIFADTFTGPQLPINGGGPVAGWNSFGEIGTYAITVSGAQAEPLAVPEPASLALFMSGLLGLAVRRRGARFGWEKGFMPTKIVRSAKLFLWALFALGAASTAALAQVKSTYVSLGSGTQGILYEPSAPGDKARIALYIEHPYSSYMNFSACTQLATRGYRILCADGPFTNNANGYEGYDQMAPGIKAGITYLRGVAGVTKVVLMGHSMGAPMVAFYQNIAQNSAATCQTRDKFLPCNASNLRTLPKADGLVLLDAHLGDALATLTYVDPAILDEAHPVARYQPLDMFSPVNGYDNAKSQASYTTSFRRNFLTWQAERNANLIAKAQQMMSLIAYNGGDLYVDDMPFNVAGANGARLWQPDLGLLRQTKSAHTLLKADGSTPTQVIVSVRPPSGKGDAATSYASGDLPASVRTFLGAHAIRTFSSYDQSVDDLTGIDYASSNTSTAWNVEGVTVPLLLICHTAHYFCRPDEIVFEHSASPDKTLAANEGATHGITACTNCGGNYGDTIKREYDYIDAWLSARF